MPTPSTRSQLGEESPSLSIYYPSSVFWICHQFSITRLHKEQTLHLVRFVAPLDHFPAPAGPAGAVERPPLLFYQVC